VERDLVRLDHFADRAANIPEFVPLPADAIAKIKEQFLDAYSFLRAGMASERTGNYPAAVKAYERGLAVEPENVELLNSLGFALFQQGRSKEAVVALEKAHYNLRSSLARSGKFAEAESHLRKSLKISPNTQTYTGLGIVLSQLGRTEEAVANLQAAVEADPKNAMARQKLAAMLESLGRTDEARKQMEMAKTLN